jgi:hypothetical protein
MELAVIWAWIVANEAALATILLVVSELMGANTKFKSNGILSFLLLQLQDFARKRGAADPTPEDGAE